MRLTSHIATVSRSNRTFMELKYIRIIQDWIDTVQVLIVPLWN